MILPANVNPQGNTLRLFLLFKVSRSSSSSSSSCLALSLFSLFLCLRACSLWMFFNRLCITSSSLGTKALIMSWPNLRNSLVNSLCVCCLHQEP